MIIEAIKICEKLNLHQPVAEQCQYNALIRERFEQEYRVLFEKYGYGTTTWSPLAQGVLTGKFNDGKIAEGSRFDKNQSSKDFVWQWYFSDDKKENTLRMINKLAEAAQELGYTQAQVALAWGIASGDVSSQLLGFSRLE